MGATILAAYPLRLIGWEDPAGIAFVLAMLIAWIVAAGGAIKKFWKG